MYARVLSKPPPVNQKQKEKQKMSRSTLAPPPANFSLKKSPVLEPAPGREYLLEHTAESLETSRRRHRLIDLCAARTMKYIYGKTFFVNI